MRVHASNIFAKLGCSDRAVAEAFGEGLLMSTERGGLAGVWLLHLTTGRLCMDHTSRRGRFL